MRKLLLLTLFLILTLGAVDAQSAGDEGIGDPYFPSLGNGGYDVQHYTIELNVNMDENEIGGTVTIDALATEDLNAFNLDFLGFSLHDVQVNGEEAIKLREGRELTIIPPAN